MKFLLILITYFTFLACSTGASNSGKPYNEQLADIGNFSSVVHPEFENIQQNVKDAFVKSIMNKNDEELISLEKQLIEYDQKKSQNIFKYWIAYLKYYHSIYFLQIKDKEKSENKIDEGIEILEKMKNKNSEDYALLSLMKSFSIQFKKGMKIPFISSKVSEYAELAIELDTNNLRAYYVSGSNDYYTPEKYGGQTEAEDYFLKAISLPDQKVKNNYLPSWGKEESYELLIKFYIKKERWDDAKKYYQIAIKKYPDNYTINKLASKLVGK